MINYENKYLKYKHKYYELKKKQKGGTVNNVSILLVCSAEVSNTLHNTIDFDQLEGNEDGMKETFILYFGEKEGSDLYNKVIKENLYYYNDDDDPDHEFPNLHIDSIPKEYHDKIFVHLDAEGSPHLSKFYNKKLIIRTIKKLIPLVSSINYTTVDMYRTQPIKQNLVNTMNLELASKFKLSEFVHKAHYTNVFQSYINKTTEIYDIVWFMGCTNIHFVIDQNEKFITNFKKIIPNGFIINSDYFGQDFPEKTVLQNLYSQSNYRSIDFKDKNKIDFLMSYLNEIEPGIYKWK
jgi:hypothetical protein